MDKTMIKREIEQHYSTEDTNKLALRLGLTKANLQKIASRMGIKKGIKTNAIVNGKKLCPCCNKMLKISEFNKDKYQPNGLDYYCRKCRKTKPTTVKKTVPKKTVIKNNDMAFHKRKTSNPIIMVKGVQSLRCKACGVIKPLTEFHKDNHNVSGHKNFCKSCVSEKKKRARA